MTGLFGWLPRDRSDIARVLAEMGCALRTHSGEAWATHVGAGVGVGVLDGVTPSRVDEWAAPVRSADGRHALWLAGEIFDAPGLVLDAPQDAATARVRAQLLDRLVTHGPSILRAVDGEYLIAWWDARRQTMSLLSDRFGGLSHYWAEVPSGVAFACGVRGVLMAPGMSSDADLDALRDAATYGGYRLGAHTNVRAVRMFPGGVHATVTAESVRVARYWSWSEVVERPDVTLEEAAEHAAGLWRRAMGRRLRGAARPGQTLSGGLDSRAILAEAATRGLPWTAITYGLLGCEDACHAERAARVAGATWLFHPLYSKDWLAERTAQVQRTDGLIQLSDLMHLESLPLQVEHMDVHVSGYIGDVVAGPTDGQVRSPESAMRALPYYGTPVSRTWDEALERVRAVTVDPGWTGSRFLLFEHKRPQSTNRVTVALRPWMRVRKPFMDYELFDYCQSLPWELRGRRHVYGVWLRRQYPEFFARIPNHKTGAPVLSPAWRLQAARATRALRRSWLRAAGALGLPHRPWHRAYFDDEGQWKAPAIRRRMTDTILRQGSIACDVFGREAVAGVLNDWFTRGAAPAQVVGALYVYEHYHAGLAAHIAAARTAATGTSAQPRGPWC